MIRNLHILFPTLGSNVLGAAAPILARGIAAAYAVLELGFRIVVDRRYSSKMIPVQFRTGFIIQILFYPNRRSASHYLLAYSFMEPSELSLNMEIEMIGEIEQSSPKTIVFLDDPFFWGLVPGLEALILEWARNYIEANYNIAGAVDVLSSASVVYRCWEEARSHSRASSAMVLVFERG